MELRMAAARKRTSINALIRERLGMIKHKTDKKELSARLENFAKVTAKKHPGVSLSQKLIEMRYEQ